MLLTSVRMFREYIIPMYTRVLIASYFIATYFVFACISDFHPGNLVDEAYHLDMGLKYCKGNYDQLNEEVTTLPGLYYISVFLLRFMKLVLQTDTCSIFFLRLVNYFAGISNVPLFGLIIKKICERKACYYEQGKYNSRIYTINHGLFPVLYFLSFFYYSEPMSVFTVFLAYYLHLKGRHTIAACTGIIAIMVDQTNVIWVVFMNLVHFITAMMYDMRKWDNYRDIIDAGDHVPIIKILVRHIVHVFVTCDKLINRYIINSAYTFVCIACLLFAVANKGIVVVDIDAHSFVIHIPQLLYFCFFYIIFTPCSVLLSLPKFLRWISSAKKETALIAVSLAIIIKFNTLIHPSLLENNKQSTFYVWKQLYYGNIMYNYLLIPVYMLGGYSIMEKLKDEKTPFLLAYIFCIVLLLVPQQDFDFRYFILPYSFLTVHSSKRNVFEVFLESIYYVLINVFTLIHFFNQEIVSSDDVPFYRFLWW